MAVLRLVERPGAPLFHVEHYIEGSYVKYNSNSGYVSSSNARMTPHAFSHFTFERSGHELIVVDVQGVGDLYTDPQVHTASGTDYGDGNLGTRGMALFFHSHFCNSICTSLGLSQFDMARSEMRAIQDDQRKVCPKTQVRGSEEIVTPPTDEQRNDLHEYLRQRSLSSGCITQEDESIIASLNIGSLESLDENDSAIASATRHQQRGIPRIRRRTDSNSFEPCPVRRSSGGSNNSGTDDDLFLAELSSKSPQGNINNQSLSPLPNLLNVQRSRLDSSSSECDSVTAALEMNNVRFQLSLSGYILLDIFMFWLCYHLFG